MTCWPISFPSFVFEFYNKALFCNTSKFSGMWANAITMYVYIYIYIYTYMAAGPFLHATEAVDMQSLSIVASVNKRLSAVVSHPASGQKCVYL